MENLAIIPARGGSKRIPHKNITPFLGKPLIAYSIERAIQSDLFSEVMVSTDDERIAEISREFGAIVPFFRSKKNSDDYATLADVIHEVIDTYRNRKTKFQHVCCILATSPLLTYHNLNKGYNLLLSGKYNTVRPVVRFDYPIQRAYTMNKGKVDFMYPEYQKTRSQDLEPAFHDAGQFYWMYFDKGMAKSNKGGFEISSMEVQDIDNNEDLKLAELKYTLLNSI